MAIYIYIYIFSGLMRILGHDVGLSELAGLIAHGAHR